jgi:hypothetical protein
MSDSTMPTLPYSGMIREKDRPIYVISQKNYGTGPIVVLSIHHDMGLMETWVTPTEARQLAEHLLKASEL